MNLPFPPRLLAAWLAALATAASSLAADKAPPAAPLPVPPAQHQAFSAPASDLPPDVAEAARRIFALGLADPRGCEYREIEVTTGDCWGQVERVKTHGWVLPDGGAQRYAVAWNGLVYPVLSVGGAANLRADVEAGLAADKARLDEAVALFESAMKRALGKKTGMKKMPPAFDMVSPRLPRIQTEASSVSLPFIQPIRAALLLRLGEGRLASAVWKQWFDALSPSLRPEPFLSLAGDWLWSRYDRAIGAHMRGEDRLALADANGLAELRDAVLQEANERAEKDTRMSSTQKAATQKEKDWLSEAAALESDTRRRLAEPPRVPVLDQPAGPDRIAGLIRDLEFVSARQWSQPGGVSFSEDPIVSALIREGNAAVPALLDCLENDTRLTRSVRFHRDFSPYRKILGTHEAAYAALSAVLDTGFFASLSTSDSLSARGDEGRKLVAAKIRDYWERYKALPIQERWYAILSDDKSPPGLIIQTAENIIRPTDIRVERSSTLGVATDFVIRQPGEAPPMQGEPLRAKTSPSVSDLLVKQLHALSQPGAENDDPGRAIRIALVLAKWDGPSHIAELRGTWRAISQAKSAKTQLRNLATLANERHRIGDPEALSDYGAWLLTLSPQALVESQFDGLFNVIWQHPDDPSMREAADALFARDGALLAPEMAKGSCHLDRLIASPLIGMPSFRVAVLRLLADKTVIGFSMQQPSGYIQAQFGNGSTSSAQSFVHDDPLAAPPGEHVPARVCDIYAWQVSRLEGAPKFQPIWPIEKRDAVIAETVKFLQRYGDNFKFQPSDNPDAYSPVSNNDLIHFPRLARPATPEDVERGRAIFSAEGERRVLPMPEHPMDASWITLKDNPTSGSSVDPATGQTTSHILYQTSGRVFQAEEVKENGEWKLYFGFAGPFHLAKVPGEEIRFVPKYVFLAANERFSLAIPKIENLAPFGAVRPDASGTLPDLKATLSLRNCAGQYLPVPPSLLPSSGGARVPGLTLQLDYSPRIVTKNQEFFSLDWKKLPPQSPTALAIEPRPLAPAAETPAASADLRQLYDLQPGSYRLQVLPAERSSGMTASEPYFFTVLPKAE